MCCLSFLYISNVPCRSRRAAAGQRWARLSPESGLCLSPLVSGKAAPGSACGQTYLYVAVTNRPHTLSDSELVCSTSSWAGVPAGSLVLRSAGHTAAPWSLFVLEHLRHALESGVSGGVQSSGKGSGCAQQSGGAAELGGAATRSIDCITRFLNV